LLRSFDIFKIKYFLHGLFMTLIYADEMD